ncbi:hypothetical protein [Roseimaritima ulvae]|uniref:Uncharacterized protein n=1 Tax=Roseimaritima ulvae TaxID=980254 RepID=A0A5B9QMZ6_9BACT|nr:hypothetical protein [Roseimaritima ulvae]QEG40467.1 hypothetical protein UC8_24790 [Roseimaritima ulvae]
MTKLDWSSADEAWTASLSTAHFDDLEIRVVTDGESAPPTDAQLKAVALIEQIAQKGLPPTKELARKYAMEYLGPDEVEDMEDEDLAIEIHAAIVPRLRDTESTYIMFVGNSDIDMEHGVAILCKDGIKLAVTHSDVAYANHDWDETAEFEQLIGG